MTNLYWVPNYRKMYPDASEEVIKVLKVPARKMQYQEYDLKAERFTIDSENNKVTAIPSREDSYERLLDIGMQFEERIPGVEEQMLKRMESERLHKALSFLSADEQHLIREIYFHERAEHDLAKELRCSQCAVNKRKKTHFEQVTPVIGKFIKISVFRVITILCQRGNQCGGRGFPLFL